MSIIYYGVQGEGLGHATRSKTIIEHLKKKHRVIILCGGRAFQYLSKHFTDVVRITSPHIFYKGDKASSMKTFFLNLFKVPKFLSSYFTARKLSREIKPDIIITDFEPICSYFGMLHDIPVISIDNQHLMTKTMFEMPDDKWWPKFSTKIIVKLMVWKENISLIISFFEPQSIDKGCHVVKPIIRKEIQTLKKSYKDFIVVYQTSFTNTDLVPSLNSSKEKFVVYGYPAPGKNNNIRFAQFDEKQFFSDLSSCKAIISNGGQSLISEAIYLKKPILSVPVKNQFEQKINAYYIQKMGFGEMADKISPEAISRFMSNIDVYRKNLSKVNMIGNKEMFRYADKAIKDLTKKK